MPQQRLKPLSIKRKRPDYPQLNYIDKHDVQWIELNRGCKRQCSYCYSDPNFKEFPIPKIESNKVQIIGEGFLYDSRIPQLLKKLPIKFEDKFVYYGFSQGLDYRLLTPRIIQIFKDKHYGLITNRGKWKQGMRLSWDRGKHQIIPLFKTIQLLEQIGYKRLYMSIFILVNWKIPYKECLTKLKVLKQWKIMADDCTWNCTKKNFIPLGWSVKEYKNFRKMVREHNIEVRHHGFNPEKIKKIDSAQHPLDLFFR